MQLALFAAAVPWLTRLSRSHLEFWLVPGTQSDPADPTRVQKIIDYTETALQFGRPLIRPKCLTRSITLYYFLSRAGMDLSIVFGTASVDGTFSAHCWLTHNGIPFAEPQNPQDAYAILHTIPSR